VGVRPKAIGANAERKLQESGFIWWISFPVQLPGSRCVAVSRVGIDEPLRSIYPNGLEEPFVGHLRQDIFKIKC
jgi:hypothetical protein